MTMTSKQIDTLASVYKTCDPGLREHNDIRLVQISTDFINYIDMDGILDSINYFCVIATLKLNREI